MDWIIILIGWLVGIFLGLTGVGGGSLMMPILIFGLSIEPIIAVATDLLFSVITKTGGVFSYLKNKMIHWEKVKSLSLGSIPSAIVSLCYLSTINDQSEFINSIILKVLGIILLISSVVIFLKSNGFLSSLLMKNNKLMKINDLIKHNEKNKKTLLTIAGVIIGCVVAISSVGAGILGALTLFILHPKMKVVNVVATDIAHAIPLATVAGIGHLLIGIVDWNLLFLLITGSLPGIYIGSRISLHLPDRLLKVIMAITFLLISIKCLI